MASFARAPRARPGPGSQPAHMPATPLTRITLRGTGAPGHADQYDIAVTDARAYGENRAPCNCTYGFSSGHRAPSACPPRPLSEQVQLLQRENMILLDRIEQDSSQHNSRVLELQDARAAERRQLESENSELKLRAAQLEHELLSVNADLLSLRGASQEHRARADHDLHRAQAMTEAARAIQAQMDDKDREIARLQGLVGDLQYDVRLAREQHTQIQQMEAKLSRYGSERAAQEESGAMLMAENTRLRQQLEHATAECERARRAARDAESRGDAARSEAAALQAENRLLHDASDQLRASIDGLRQREAAWATDRSTREGRLQDVERELNSLMQMVDEQHAAGQARERELAGLQDEHRALLQRLADAEGARNASETLAASLRTEIEGVRRQLALLQGISKIRWRDLEEMAGAVKDFTHTMDQRGDHMPGDRA
eukprot:m.264836 g.264836  ORF g.264836 m.264836 type:complete len:431 (+) comp28640_c0_seq1:68-1360(+)